MQKRRPFPLVVIDAKELIYRRYVGRAPGVKVRAEAPLTATEVELFRVHPEAILPPEPPVLA